MTPRYTYIWEFTVKAEHVVEFQRHYGPHGSWVALFRQAPGYIDTLLLRDRTNPQRFITVDRWQSAEAHGSFRSAFSQQYAELDARFSHLTAEEISLGVFNEEVS